MMEFDKAFRENENIYFQLFGMYFPTGPLISAGYQQEDIEVYLEECISKGVEFNELCVDLEEEEQEPIIEFI